MEEIPDKCRRGHWNQSPSILREWNVTEQVTTVYTEIRGTVEKSIEQNQFQCVSDQSKSDD